jgi:hypothetical protein
MKYAIMVLCAIIALNAQAQRRQPATTPTIRVDTAKTNVVFSDSVKAPKRKGIDVNPVKVWKDGKTVDGVDLDVDVAYEDLDKMVRFYYQLKDSAGVQIANGNVEVAGKDYDDYKTLPNHAQRAYNIVLRHLRLQQKPTNQN